MKQLAFLIIFSTSSLKNIAQILSHYFWLNQLIMLSSIYLPHEVTPLMAPKTAIMWA
jgi:hypothetical protein